MILMIKANITPEVIQIDTKNVYIAEKFAVLLTNTLRIYYEYEY